MMLTPLPLLLRETMSELGLDAVERWWEDLDESGRRDVIELWQETASAGPVEVRVSGVFVDRGELGDDSGFWHNDFYEYLVNNEIYLLDPIQAHVCTRHPLARAAVQRGLIPDDFECPFSNGNCPMRGLLERDPGRSIRLGVTFKSKVVR
ncbi:hypothetical protein [Verrucomicrobium sp. BvORR106]|uniref:hypothetical protein n=1 Tax=Verrucomicrobium sp. BvORR106 TaxID=1403819 RepID=UPI00056F983A|nr:hypothetical protein [Verrucomicrobium sp. BvORR106]